MTLNLMLINQHGIWQSSDFRLSHPETGDLVDDFSVKHVSFRCSDGAALLTYCGVGRVTPPRTAEVHLSDWIRQTIRGQSLTLDETVIRICEQATADLGDLLLKIKRPHMFSIGAFIGRVPWLVQVRNFAGAPNGIGPVQREFETTAKKIEGAMAAWWPAIVSEADQGLMHKVVTKQPRKPRQFSDRGCPVGC